MIDLNYNRRFKEVTTITDSDFIYYDNGTQILQRILYSDFKIGIGGDTVNNTILSGGYKSSDEDIYKMFGGNGVSINSKKLTDE
jgi:hypothetical protein